MTSLVDEARNLLVQLEPHVPAETGELVRHAKRRLDEPLRVAIAGRVKAGKSTLLNAVIGQAAAATDAAECTRAVTWYGDGLAYRAWVLTRGGQRSQAPYRRTHTAARVDLEAHDLDRVERVEVEFPSQHLRSMTLIDTPGIASVSEQVSARAVDFLAPDHGDQGADVVVYLLRHVHERDADFLEAFTDPAVARVGAVRSVAVLSRADEVGNGRGDALQVAQRVAQHYADHPILSARVADVLPVAGLLAFTAATLTEAEFGHLTELVRLSQLELERLLVGVDLFMAESLRVPVPTKVRRLLLDRFGLFGIRLATTLIRNGACRSAGELATVLEERSGIQPLRRLLLDRFAGRADVLKAARAIDLVKTVMERTDLPAHLGVWRDLERVRSSSHELVELRSLATALGPGQEWNHLDSAVRQQALVSLGRDGREPWHRLGAPAGTPTEELIALALRRVEELRVAAAAPFIDDRSAEVLRTAIRSIEAVHFQLVSTNSQHAGDCVEET